MAHLKESSSNETKNTAGGKHETALAMLQIEQSNVGAQLQEILYKKAALEKIDPSLLTDGKKYQVFTCSFLFSGRRK